MAHDSRCATAMTDVGSCECECGGRLHGIGDGNNDYQTQTITPEEQRIDQEFSEHFKPDDFDRLRDDADFEAWEKLVEEKPELAQKLQAAEDDPDIDFEVGDIFWEKTKDNRMAVIVPGIDGNDELNQDRKNELIDAAYEYMERKKANQYSTKEDMLQELNETMTEKGAFPEMEYIESSLKRSDNNTNLDDVTWLYEGRHRFGPLVVETDYKITEEGDFKTNTKWINTDNYDFDKRAQDIVEQRIEHEDMENIDDVDQWIKAHHTADPQIIFTMFNESNTDKRPQLS